MAEEKINVAKATDEELKDEIARLKPLAWPSTGVPVGVYVVELGRVQQALAHRQQKAAREKMFAELAEENRKHEEKRRTIMETARRFGMDNW